MAAVGGGNIKVVVRVRPFNGRGKVEYERHLHIADTFRLQNSDEMQNASFRCEMPRQF